jgi:hypothetical protein
MGIRCPHFHCDSHKKKKHCDCPKLVKDCICVEWSIPHGETQTVFQTTGFNPIFASGFISFDCGSPDLVRVRFFLGNNLVGDVIRVFADSSVAFTSTRFDRITVECPDFIGTPDSDCPTTCEGEICITVRYPVC